MESTTATLGEIVAPLLKPLPFLEALRGERMSCSRAIAGSLLDLATYESIRDELFGSASTERLGCFTEFLRDCAADVTGGELDSLRVFLTDMAERHRDTAIILRYLYKRVYADNDQQKAVVRLQSNTHFLMLCLHGDQRSTVPIYRIGAYMFFKAGLFSDATQLTQLTQWWSAPKYMWKVNAIPVLDPWEQSSAVHLPRDMDYFLSDFCYVPAHWGVAAPPVHKESTTAIPNHAGGGGGAAGAAECSTRIETLAKAVAELVPSSDEVADDKQYQCSVCCKRKRCVLMMPCGHIPVCQHCAVDVLNTRPEAPKTADQEQGQCPTCRVRVTNVMRVFM